MIAGAVLGNQIGPAAAIDPVHLNGLRCGQRDLVVGAGYFDERLADRVGGQRFQRGGDGRERRFVTGQQMPIGGRVGRVGAAGPHQIDRLAGLGRSRPRARYPVLAVHHDVDRDLAGRGVDMTNRHGPYRRLFLGGQVGKAVQRQRLRQSGHVDVVCDEYQLDVGVGEVAGHEGVEITAPKHYPDHVRCELLGTDDFEAFAEVDLPLVLLSRPDPRRLYEPRPIAAAWPAAARTIRHRPSWRSTNPATSRIASGPSTCSGTSPDATAISSTVAAPRPGNASYT